MKRKLFIAAIVCLTFLTLLMVSGCKMVYLNSSRLEMIAAVNERAFAKDAEILEDSYGSADEIVIIYKRKDRGGNMRQDVHILSFRAYSGV